MGTAQARWRVVARWLEGEFGGREGGGGGMKSDGVLRGTPSYGLLVL